MSYFLADASDTKTSNNLQEHRPTHNIRNSGINLVDFRRRRKRQHEACQREKPLSQRAGRWTKCSNFAINPRAWNYVWTKFLCNRTCLESTSKQHDYVKNVALHNCIKKTYLLEKCMSVPSFHSFCHIGCSTNVTQCKYKHCSHSC